MITAKLQDALTLLKKTQLLYSSELQLIGPGRLQQFKANSGRTQFCIRTRQDNKEIRRGITKQPELIHRFARKEFLLRALDHIESNITNLEVLLGKFRSCSPEDIAAELTATFDAVPAQYFLYPLTNPIPSPADTPYLPPAYRDAERTVVTSRGERMRSKAEVLVAERLYAFGIPFRYEQELTINGAIFHPDFTFVAVDGSPIYLEFCGMMDLERYVSAHKRKLAAYLEAGITPWDNIIFLYAKSNDLDLRYVDAAIQTQLLPRLQGIAA